MSAPTLPSGQLYPIYIGLIAGTANTVAGADDYRLPRA